MALGLEDPWPTGLLWGLTAHSLRKTAYSLQLFARPGHLVAPLHQAEPQLQPFRAIPIMPLVDHHG